MSKLLGIFILVSTADSYSVSWSVSMSHLIPGNRKLYNVGYHLPISARPVRLCF